jgi:hypothetical protein
MRLERHLFLSLTFFLGYSISCNPQNEQKGITGQLLYADEELMYQLRKDYQEGESDVEALVSRVVDCADDLLDEGPYSVMQKDVVPPSGDKHDYISQGPYWWPDTTKADGLPYIRRDGVVNPERDKFTDRANLHKVITHSEQLSKSYFFTEEEKYAEKATELLRTWFIDDSTKMNPHLEFGQGIPGITEGRGIGIIETRRIGKVADAVALIRNSQHWSDQLDNEMQTWMKEYLHWLTHSEKGLKESVHPNNHGTWYDVQAISLALFTGQDSIARAIAERAKKLRFDKHVMADGSQPEELARTRSFSYSAMNLRGLFLLAYLSENLNIDLWNYQNAHGATLEQALRFLVPAAIGKEDWEYEQIKPIANNALKFHLFLATKVYNEEYIQIANMLPEDQESMNCEDIELYFY